MSESSILAEHSFALCLTHDVDRVRKTYQPLYYALTERDPSRLLDYVRERNSYWQFETVMAIEAELGVRSAFYFLDEQNLFRDKPPRTWLRPEYWKLYVGRYAVDDPAIVDVIHALDTGGWEVGLHGSYESYRDTTRLRTEKRALEDVLGHPVVGGRQHYLNLDRPRTWQRHAEIGLRYDSTLGSADSYGFEHGYRPLRPFDDEFVVFPLTLMELTLPDVDDDPEGAWAVCESLLAEARENDAVMTVLWHPSYFSEPDHPNYAGLYRRLIERALEMGAWVGPPGELYESLDHPTGAEAADTDGATGDQPDSVGPAERNDHVAPTDEQHEPVATADERQDSAVPTADHDDRTVPADERLPGDYNPEEPRWK